MSSAARAALRPPSFPLLAGACSRLARGGTTAEAYIAANPIPVGHGQKPQVNTTPCLRARAASQMLSFWFGPGQSPAADCPYADGVELAMWLKEK